MGTGDRPKRRYSYGQGAFTLLYDELRSKLAYQDLSPTHRLVLLDMLRVYGRASNGDTVGVSSGFIYTYSHCQEVVSRNEFYRAIRRILEVGFFDAPPEKQELRAAAPRRFLPSNRWQKYEPAREQASKLRKRKAKKETRLARDRKRRTDFRTGLGVTPRAKRPETQRQNEAPQKGGTRVVDNGRTLT